MFYKMIENKCTQWYESDQCTVKNLIEYIKKTGQMRDAQIEAIKVYLFLKIACESKPLMQLFRQGFFNSIDVTIQYPVKYILIFRQNRENKISVSSSFQCKMWIIFQFGCQVLWVCGFLKHNSLVLSR